MQNKETVYVPLPGAETTKETEKAYLVKFAPGGEMGGEETEKWLPKSQIKMDGTTMTLPEWLYNKTYG